MVSGIGLIAVIIYIVYVGGPVLTRDEATVLPPLPDSPERASYSVGAHTGRIDDLLQEEPVSGDVPVRETQRSVEGSVRLDVNGDGYEDAVVLLALHDDTEERSSEARYIAVALYDGEGYQGSNALYFGDVVSGLRAFMRYGVLEVRALREDTEVTAYYLVDGAYLKEVEGVDREHTLLAGTLTYEGETGNVLMCDGTARTLISDSPSAVALRAIYSERLSSGVSNVFVVLTGYVEDDAVFAARVVRAPMHDPCESVSVPESGNAENNDAATGTSPSR